MRDNQGSFDIRKVYWDVFVLSENLVILAKNNNWAELIQKETEYISAVENLVLLSQKLNNHKIMKNKLIDLLHKIIENENIVKTLLHQALTFLMQENKIIKK
ncbi:flagellar protein FliT [Providencia sneebia]|uniref:Flagellar protein FliT n=1 Tax=Providencia sneebia DSM 19967 TaxID=1141660 RepID=K8WF80_9GAMM|nr:flagellar protein FliT [Providencia sneebia]EKT58586.1 flagella protein [Providencia sneebia DSM 19967]